MRYVALAPEALGRTLAPMIGEQAAAGVAHDYEFLHQRSPLMDLDADTTAARRELGVAATPLVQWARTQPWTAMAGPAPTA